MTAFIVVLHILVCLFLILFVLLQPGARGGVGAAFGGAGGQTVFGGRGANTFLAKLTAAAALVFMLTSIALSYFASHGTSVMEGRATPTLPAPAEAPNAGTDGSGLTPPAPAAAAEGAAATPPSGAATTPPAAEGAATTPPAPPAGGAAAPAGGAAAPASPPSP